MTPIQPTLDGTIPTPKIPAARRKAESFEAWVEAIHSTFLMVAQSGRIFMLWEIEQEYNLPLAPDPAHDPGRYAARLHRDGITRFAGYGQTRDKSAVRKWRGTAGVIAAAAARTERAA